MANKALEARLDIEERYLLRDERINQKLLWYHRIHILFTRHDKSIENGRPHHLKPWISGLLSGWGARRG